MSVNYMEQNFSNQPSQPQFSPQNQVPPLPPQKPKKHISTWLGIVIILVVAIFAFGGVFAYQYLTPDIQVPTYNIQPDGPALSGVEGWKTYTNTEYGFEFKYPDSLAITEGGCGRILAAAICPSDENKNEVINSKYFSVEIFTPNATAVEDWNKIFSLPLREFVQKLWQYNKNFKNGIGVEDIYETKIGGDRVYGFNLSNYMDFPWQGLMLSKKADLIFFSNPSNSYNGIVTFNDDDSVLVNKILSTFKFTK